MDTQSYILLNDGDKDMGRIKFNKNDRFKKNSKVWYYDSPLKPVIAVVRAKRDYGWEIEIPKKVAEEGKIKKVRITRISSGHDIFVFPEERWILTTRLREDADSLKEYAKEIETS